MKISHVRIKNILGIEELEFNPGQGFTEIVGPNGAGKTTVLEAIKSVLKGGHDATLLREGQEKGEIVLDLDDGTEVTKTVRPHTSDTVVKRDGRKQPRPAELIKSLVDQLSNNPVSFLTAKKEDRVSIFLQSVPLTVDGEYLERISGVKVENAETQHAYHVLEFAYETVFKERTGTNVAIDSKEKTIKQLRLAMPDLPAGVVGGEDELEAKLAELDARKDTDLGEVHTKLSAFTQQMDQQIQTESARFDSLIEDLQKQIETLRSDKAAAVAALRTRISTVTAKANAKRTEIKDTHQAERVPFETQLTTLRTNRDAAAKRELTLETIKNMDAELVQLRQDAQRQTKALEDIKQYRSDLLAKLPIPNVEVRNGEIYRNNVVFDRLNTAQRVDMAVEIAKLRAGELPAVCVDGIEAMDSQTFNEFRDRAIQSGLQFFVSRVTNGPFDIHADVTF